MKVYNITNPSVVLLEEIHLPTGEIEVTQRYHKCKSLRMIGIENEISIIDKFLIDIRNNENAQELYLYEIEEIQTIYNPHAFTPEKGLLVTYYAHDKITKH